MKKHLDKNKEKQKIEELTDDVKRIHAEFENFRKRYEKEKNEFARFANAQLISDFLPVLDSIEEALKHSKDNGIRGIKKQLFGVLEKQGLREINSLGEKFNPDLHEVLLKECVKEKENNEVLEELQKGYLLNEKVLRHSKIKINYCEEKKESELSEQHSRN